MSNTILAAVFKDYGTAHQAERELLQNGFSQDEVRVSSNAAPNTRTTGSQTIGSPQHEGGISGFFSNLFGGHSAQQVDGFGEYAEAVTSGKSVLTVSIEQNRVPAATDILENYDLVNLEERQSAANGSTGEKVIPIVEEELKVGKRTVQTGGVRVYTTITETPVNENITLREEHARVERRPVDRPATEADFHSGEQVIEVTEKAEEVVIAKTARVVEEVVIGKVSSQRTENVEDTVRRTQVEVEQIAPEVASDFRRDYDARYAAQTGARYDAYAPAYDYGYELSNDPQYSGKSWGDVESTVKSDYAQKYPNSTWERMSGAVRYGWEKATHKH